MIYEFLEFVRHVKYWKKRTDLLWMRNLLPKDKAHKDALQDRRTLKNYIDGGISVHAMENHQQLVNSV